MKGKKDKEEEEMEQPAIRMKKNMGATSGFRYTTKLDIQASY